MEEIWGCMDSVLSRMAPRLLNWSERAGQCCQVGDLRQKEESWFGTSEHGLFYRCSRGACFLSSNSWCRRNTQWLNWGGSWCFQVLHYRKVQCCQRKSDGEGCGARRQWQGVVYKRWRVQVQGLSPEELSLSVWLVMNVCGLQLIGICFEVKCERNKSCVTYSKCYEVCSVGCDIW